MEILLNKLPISVMWLITYNDNQQLRAFENLRCIHNHLRVQTAQYSFNLCR